MVIHHLSNPGHLTSKKFCSNVRRLNDPELINYLHVKPCPPDFGSIVGTQFMEENKVELNVALEAKNGKESKV